MSDSIPSEDPYLRMIDVISQLVLMAFTEGFLDDLHLAYDATHFRPTCVREHSYCYDSFDENAQLNKLQAAA